MEHTVRDSLCLLVTRRLNTVLAETRHWFSNLNQVNLAHTLPNLFPEDSV